MDFLFFQVFNLIIQFTLLFTSKNMIKRDNKLSVRRQCELLGNQPV